MIQNSITGMIREIRRLGCVKNLAEFMARFFFCDETLVWIMAGMLERFTGLYFLMNANLVPCGAMCPAVTYYAHFGIQR